ncbi:subtilisin-like protease SBT5.6 isoform X1 [Carya illinoinensis]|uniref:subtilisin-like protease SBT5.6 isoform X1 n=1 Tax=Carya illinoinensis TaxID=32201 RepID=UPI001C71E51D|nr:subtilisin-like protease SBT5.6 isoform X1 [Carya illinoinensis]
MGLRIRSFSFLFSTFPLLLSLLLLISTAMAESAPTTKPGDSSSSASVQIVYTERPQGEDPEAYHIRTLTAVLGSEAAAKEALLYSYKTAASGFSAKLTPDQVSQISMVFINIVRLRNTMLSSLHTIIYMFFGRTTRCSSGCPKPYASATFRTWEAALKDVKLLHLLVYMFQTAFSCINHCAYVLWGI